MTSPYLYPNESVDPETLDTEVRAGSFSASVVGVRTDEVTPGGNKDVSVLTSPDLSGAEQTELDGIIAAHTP